MMEASYKVVGGDEAFSSRISKVFADVDKLTTSLPSQTEAKPDFKNHKHRVNNDASTRPAFEIHPEQWTKYDLSSVKATDDRENTQAAFLFLHSLQKRSKLNVSSTCELPGDPSVAGVETIKNSLPSSVESDKPVTFVKPVQIMPEHVVGQELVHRKVHSALQHVDDIPACDKVELDHLEQNVSATEFQEEIAEKLEDSLKQTHSAFAVNKSHFKVVNKNRRTKRSVRSRTSSEDN